MRKLITSAIQLAFVSTFVTACGGQEGAESPPMDNAAATAEPVANIGVVTPDMASLEITAESMRSHIVELSDDKYEGRGPGSRGDAAARQYIQSEMEKLGLEPEQQMGLGNSPLSSLALRQNSLKPGRLSPMMGT